MAALMMISAVRFVTLVSLMSRAALHQCNILEDLSLSLSVQVLFLCEKIIIFFVNLIMQEHGTVRTIIPTLS